jgi:hypothetical protein
LNKEPRQETAGVFLWSYPKVEVSFHSGENRWRAIGDIEQIDPALHTQS